MEMEKLNQLLELCIKIQAETEHDAFFNYSGHVNWIDIYIDKGGFKGGLGDESEFFDNIRLDNEKEIALAIKKLQGYLKEN